MIYGLAGGGIAVAFHSGIQLFYEHSIHALTSLSVGWFLIGSFATVVGTSTIAGWLMNSFCPEAAGSGIPQVKVAFWKDMGVIPWRVVWVKFIGGILSVGGGASLGREGPSVQFAAGLSSNLAGALGEPAQNRRLSTAAGAAAGLAAAFNTPIAAATFALEEIIGDLNSRLLGGVLLASVLGALVAHAILGVQPAFQLHGVTSAISWLAFAAVPAVAALSALTGVGFQRLALRIRARFLRATLPRWLMVSLGGMIVWAIGATVFVQTGHEGVFGLGYEDLSSALDARMGWKIALLLLAAKLIATSCCYGLGGCGGIFAPTLFFGGMCGAGLADLLELITPLAASDHVMLAVIGMSACLSAVVRAPVTGILIVFEMTHEFMLVPPLIVAALIALWVSRRFNKHSFYDALLHQSGQDISQVVPPRDLRAWADAPISRIANFRPVLVRDTSPAALETLLAEKPFDRFPVVHTDARPIGLLTRDEALAAIAEQREPTLTECPIVRREASVREVQHRLIDAPDGMVLIQAGADDRIIGLVTLHDLLRAEAAFSSA